MDRRRSAHIVSEIYEATIDPSHWDYVLTMIAKLTRSSAACLYYVHDEMDVASTIAQYGLNETRPQEIGDRWESLDHLFGSNVGRGVDDSPSRQFQPDENDVLPVNPELYRDWLRPQGIYHIGGARFVDADSHRAGIVIMRSRDAGAWSGGDLRVIDEILPHLGQAFKIHSEFTHLRLKQDALLKGLDRLVIGLILYDRNAAPVYINPTARSIIEQHPALQMHDGELILSDPDEDRKLRKTILETAEIDPDDSWKQSVAIGLTHPDTDAPLPLLVTPMHAQLVTSELDYEGARVALFMSDPNPQQPISIDSLVSVYSLTPSEAQVAISLANGHSIDEIASISNHSAHTIRSQLKSVFRKTGVSRQSELIKLLLTGPFAQRRRSTAPD